MGIGSFLKREAKKFSTGITAQDGLQDWAHAARVFTDEDMLRSPKFKGMFHVTFVFNEGAVNNSAASGFKEALTKKSDFLSVLTKSIDLPSFNIENTTHNQYNKSTTTYKKIKFEPITVSFHDDMSDIIWGFWAFYYAWYFAEGSKGYSGPAGNSKNKGGSAKLRDAYSKLVNNVVSGVKKLFKKVSSPENTLQEVTVNSKRKPDASRKPVGGPEEWDLANTFPLLLATINENTGGTDPMWDTKWSDAWGLNGSPFYSLSTTKARHLLKAIEIYPLGNKQASVIVLHNPKIISWDHDTFDYSTQGTATCKMKIVYDGVSYLDQRSATGILETVSLYDRHPSPLMRGTPRALLGPGGILDQAEGVIGNIMNGEFGLGDLITTVGIAKSLGKKGFVNSAKAELKQTVTQAVTGAVVNKIFPGSR